MSFLRAAFDLSVDDYANRKSVDGSYSIFRVGPRTPTHVSSVDRAGWKRPCEELRDWVNALDSRMRLAAIGIDLSRYAYFDAVAPVATYLAGDNRGPLTRIRFDVVTDDHYRASYLFVVGTALRLSAQDFNLTQLDGRTRVVEAYDPDFFSDRHYEVQRENQRVQAEWQLRQSGAGASAGRATDVAPTIGSRGVGRVRAQSPDTYRTCPGCVVDAVDAGES